MKHKRRMRMARVATLVQFKLDYNNNNLNLYSSSVNDTYRTALYNITDNLKNSN